MELVPMKDCPGWFECLGCGGKWNVESGLCPACSCQQTDEQEDLLARFMVELRKPTGDGAVKRERAEKPPWYEDQSHEGAVFSHLTKWKRGELVDPDSGSHPLVHAAWRLLAIACIETGNVPPDLRDQGDGFA